MSISAGVYSAHKSTTTRFSVRIPAMLTWDASYEMALALRDAHPDANLQEVSTGQIYDWAIALPDFADDPALVNEAMLMAIFQEWYEETDGV